MDPFIIGSLLYDLLIGAGLIYHPTLTGQSWHIHSSIGGRLSGSVYSLHRVRQAANTNISCLVMYSYLAFQTVFITRVHDYRIEMRRGV